MAKAHDHQIEEAIRYSALGDLNSLKRLQMAGNVDLSTGDYDFRTPLHLASSNGHSNIVRYLVNLFG